MAAVRYTAIRWAREVPTLLHRGRVDRLGHHLLLLLATYAKNDGSDMYASVTSLAKEAHAPERDVVAALGRLEKAGLIGRAHASNGAPGWSLNVGERSDVDGVVEAREASRRAATRERTRKWRERRKVTGDAEVVRHVTPNSTVTNDDVTPDSCVTDEVVTHKFSVRNAKVLRHTTDVTHQCDAGDAGVSVTTAGQTPYNSLELPKDRTPKDELPADADASGASELGLVLPSTVSKLPARDPGTFDRFWANYPRKDNKANARKAWAKASKTHGAEFLISEAARWAGLWVAAGRDKGYMPMPTTWLNGERWTDEPPTPRTNGHHAHVPFRDRPDADYDEHDWGPA